MFEPGMLNKLFSAFKGKKAGSDLLDTGARTAVSAFVKEFIGAIPKESFAKMSRLQAVIASGAAIGIGLGVRTATNFGPFGDNVVTDFFQEVADTIMEETKDNKNAPKKKEEVEKERSKIVNILKIFINAEIKVKKGGKVYNADELFVAFNTLLDEMNDEKQAQFIEMLAQMDPEQMAKFMTFPIDEIKKLHKNYFVDSPAPQKSEGVVGEIAKWFKKAEDDVDSIWEKFSKSKFFRDGGIFQKFTGLFGVKPTKNDPVEQNVEEPMSNLEKRVTEVIDSLSDLIGRGTAAIKAMKAPIFKFYRTLMYIWIAAIGMMAGGYINDAILGSLIGLGIVLAAVLFAPKRPASKYLRIISYFAAGGFCLFIGSLMQNGMMASALAAGIAGSALILGWKLPDVLLKAVNATLGGAPLVGESAKKFTDSVREMIRPMLDISLVITFVGTFGATFNMTAYVAGALIVAFSSTIFYISYAFAKREIVFPWRGCMVTLITIGLFYQAAWRIQPDATDGLIARVDNFINGWGWNEDRVAVIPAGTIFYDESFRQTDVAQVDTKVKVEETIKGSNGQKMNRVILPTAKNHYVGGRVVYVEKDAVVNGVEKDVPSLHNSQPTQNQNQNPTQTQPVNYTTPVRQYQNDTAIVDFSANERTPTGIIMTGFEKIKIIPLTGVCKLNGSDGWEEIRSERTFPTGGNTGELYVYRVTPEGKVKVIQIFNE